jgi:hypothetical protein
VFRALSAAATQQFLRRELQPSVEVRLLDSNWKWFDVWRGDTEAIAPSVDFQPPTKQAVIALVNARTNRLETDPVYQPRSLSSRGRAGVFQELLAILPVG